MADIEIQNRIKLKKIKKIIKKNKINSKDVEFYGEMVAKIKNNNIFNKNNSKLILVTSINPTKFGEGKTTVSIGLSDALNALKKKSMVVLREPSLGPVFGIKGGATGGGYSQIAPMEDINLHFTGDFHAITSANNLIASIVDNSLYFDNPLNLNPDTICFYRCLDLNDRALRDIELNIDGKIKRKEKFNITAASELMSIMTLSKDIDDLKNRIGNILIGFSYEKKPIFFKEFGCVDAVALLLKNALKPNIVQTLRGNLAFVHLGPFANVSHGCNSIVATKSALNMTDYVVTEAGFGADLGAEKFLDFVSRVGDFAPNCVVLVITLKAVKLNGGANESDLNILNLKAIKQGLNIVKKHYENLIKIYNLNTVVALNRFASDNAEEIEYLKSELLADGVKVIECSPYEQDKNSCTQLAQTVIENCSELSKINYTYNLEDEVEEKLTKIATKVYGAKSVIYEDMAKEKLKLIKKLGFNKLPVVVAKTQYSLSGDSKKIGVCSGYDLTISDFEIYSGAGYVVAIAGKMLLMPGLSKTPNAINMKINNNGNISGLF